MRERFGSKIPGKTDISSKDDLRLLDPNKHKEVSKETSPIKLTIPKSKSQVESQKTQICFTEICETKIC